MTVFDRPDAEWLDHAVNVGVERIAARVIDACALAGGSSSPAPQGLLVPEPRGGWANPRLPGWVHEWSASGRDRSRRGAHYTPAEFAAAVVSEALHGLGDPADLRFAVDPACGGGVFLLELLDRFLAAGVEPTQCVARIAGIEIDPRAAATTRRAVRAWQLLHGAGEPPAATVIVGDALDAWPGTWPTPDLVIGNPPFASPLKSGALPPEAVAYRHHHSEVLGPYADLAAIHLWRATNAVSDGGRVAFVAPVSLINARDTAQLWRRLEGEADVVSVLIPEESPFDASVRVFAPVLEIRRRLESQRRSLGHAVAAALGIPDVPGLDDAPTLATVAGATSGFRDEFYALAGHAREEADVEGAADRRRLVNVGSIDPLVCSWGQRPLRFAKRRWDRPVVVPGELSGNVLGFVERQSRPKVLLATQSPVLEPVVDPVGDLVGITPTIVLTSDRPYHVAAVLLAPPVVALAAQRWYGTGLSETALRPTASTVLELPVPSDAELWNEAAALVERCSPPIDGTQSIPDRSLVLRIATLMTEAYGCDADLVEWWVERAGPHLHFRE